VKFSTEKCTGTRPAYDFKFLTMPQKKMCRLTLVISKLGLKSGDDYETFVAPGRPI
jgi:hypothetical protein